ncbi:hypothetical protein LCGC14_1396610, partial [marine sediment metagenome]
MKERQTMTFKMQFNRQEHYDDAGLKALDPAGHSHSFTMDIKVTSDLFDNEFTDTSEKQGLGWWIYRNTVNQPIQVLFVTSMKMLTGPAGFTTEDTVAVDDSISMRVFMSLADGLKGDSVTITDKTSAKSIFPIDDTASIDDSISKRVFYEIGER